MEFVRCRRGPQRYLPDILEGETGFRWKFDAGFQRVGPGPAEIVAGAQIRAPQRTAGRGPQSMTAVPTVVRQGINSMPMKVWPGDFPVPAIQPGPRQEGALRRAQEQEHVPVPDFEVLDAAQHQSP